MKCEKCGRYCEANKYGSLKKYCSERCRKKAELKRYYEKYPDRKSHGKRKKKQRFIPWVIKESKKNLIVEKLKPAPKWELHERKSVDLKEKRYREALRNRIRRKGMCYAGVRAALKKNDPLYAEKERAWAKLRTAVKNGVVVKPEKCERCGVEGRLQGHHYRGYEHALVVIWLCQACHSFAHMINRTTPPHREICESGG